MDSPHPVAPREQRRELLRWLPRGRPAWLDLRLVCGALWGLVLLPPWLRGKPWLRGFVMSLARAC